MHIVVPVVSAGLQLVKERTTKTNTVEGLKQRHFQQHTSQNTPSNSSKPTSVNEDPTVRELVSDFHDNCSISNSSGLRGSTAKPLGSGTPIDTVLGQKFSIEEHTEAEFRRLQEAMPSLKNYQIATHVKGDGACGFRTISVHVYGSEDYYEDVKAEVVQYALDHFKEISDETGLLPKDILCMAKKASFQGEMLFQVAALYFGDDFGLVGYSNEDKVYHSGKRNAALHLSFYSSNHFTPLSALKIERKSRSRDVAPKLKKKKR